MVFGSILWILIIIGIVLLAKWLSEQNKKSDEETLSALDVAKMRYANGEITEEEFEEMKKHLI
ncbi:putative membrane protein [Methanohalophilus levihalophilus]|uniref:SHOCT domain-containing protein n=1 Tax=Methanohalophilus levihalophilus TaxID=1431282 RepID=UPI001AE7CB30|nr:SHOCT domain-containing protein [Methanohalophilus levihalophilus]MBP2030817.1 putative membrane protein [Methanohalophilus levihalophilus]